MTFLDDSPDPFHATARLCDRLDAANFTPLDEREPWSDKIQPGGCYYFTRDSSCLVAFTVGKGYKPGNGFKILGAHTDSPNLKIKPRSKRSGSGLLQLDVQCYGGGLWHTWFDRDLALSGRVFVRTSEDTVEQRLVKVDRPILRVPTLCIHLQSPKEREAFEVNKEDHLQPILASEATKALSATGDDADSDMDAAAEGGDAESGTDWAEGQEPLLLRLLAEELEVSVESIADFELNLYDTQKAAVGGLNGEFLYSSRLDNLASCFVATEAVISHANSHLEDDGGISVLALFDHEEVGSVSATGAGSPIIGDSVRRIATALSAGAGNEDLYASSLRRSFCLSIDQAHAVHPNYASKHEKSHAPLMNQGVVIKSNANQRYASTGLTSFVIREVARRVGLPLPQEFVVRNDCPCGSTIGPVISAATGMRAVDVGMPQLSMHSVREMMGVHDLAKGLALFEGFLKEFEHVDKQLGGGS